MVTIFLYLIKIAPVRLIYQFINIYCIWNVLALVTPTEKILDCSELGAWGCINAETISNFRQYNRSKQMFYICLIDPSFLRLLITNRHLFASTSCSVRALWTCILSQQMWIDLHSSSNVVGVPDAIHIVSMVIATNQHVENKMAAGSLQGLMGRILPLIHCTSLHCWGVVHIVSVCTQLPTLTIQLPQNQQLPTICSKLLHPFARGLNLTAIKQGDTR